MNKIFVLFAFWFITINSLAQTNVDYFRHLEKNEIESLQLHMNSEVDVIINGEYEIYSQNEAVNKLKDFFTINPIVKIEAIHSGTSRKSDSKYKLAKIITNNDILRMFIYFELLEGKEKIVEVRIEKFK